ncbi:MAG: CAP domain-containing protein, partial [Clostridia bacterium]|nr:CAP domain-containing protein [Clostridia bacterium]
PDGRTVEDRLTENGMGQWRVYAENIANGYWDAVSVHAGWIASENHRSNILHVGFVRFGVGFAVGSGSSYTVEDFYSVFGE